MQQDTPSSEDTRIQAQIRAVAGRLRDERRKRGVSQIDLAYQAGLSKNIVGWIENGKLTPTIATVFKLANALGMNAAELFAPPDEERAFARETMLGLVARFL